MNIKQSVVILSNSVLVILPVVFLLASCASSFSHMFASSLYGQELESAMTACMDDVKSGLIDGVAKEDFKNIEFRSDRLNFLSVITSAIL